MLGTDGRTALGTSRVRVVATIRTQLGSGDIVTVIVSVAILFVAPPGVVARLHRRATGGRGSAHGRGRGQLWEPGSRTR